VPVGNEGHQRRSDVTPVTPEVHVRVILQRLQMHRGILELCFGRRFVGDYDSAYALLRLISWVDKLKLGTWVPWCHGS
jgi:hypothetical protein